MMIFLCFTTTN